jgi:hypothetical protein
VNANRVTGLRHQAQGSPGTTSALTESGPDYAFFGDNTLPEQLGYQIGDRGRRKASLFSQMGSRSVPLLAQHRKHGSQVVQLDLADVAAGKSMLIAHPTSSLKRQLINQEEKLSRP